MLSSSLPLSETAAYFLYDDDDDNMTSHIEARSPLREGELSPYPELEMLEWNHNVEHVERWAIFRMFPMLLKFQQYMKEAYQKSASNGNKHVILPSLYRYYNLLPKFARDSIFVKDVVKALEFTKPTMSIRDKELSLNFVCRFTLPMDKCNCH